VVEEIAVDGVRVLVVGLVGAEGGLARGDRDDVAGAVDLGLPVAHLFPVVPDELVGTLLGVVDARQAVVVNVAERGVGKVAVAAQRTLQGAVDDGGRARRIVVVAGGEVHVGHIRAVKVEGGA